MFQSKRATTAVFAVICSLGSASSFAQSTSSALVGVVRDTTGAVLPNSAITATNTATGVSYQGISNGSGEFRISNLPLGTYTVETKHDGFAISALKGVNVTANNVETTDITLTTATTTATVEVSSESAVSIDTTTSQISSTFDEQELEHLPTATVGLGALNLSLLAPGVTSTGGLGAGTGPSISGQRPRNNNFEIDGMDNNSKSVTGPELYVPNDAVSEFVLLQNIYSAQYGHSAGGQFNSLIRSGTNEIHGRAYEYVDNRNLNAVDASQALANVNSGAAVGFRPRYDFNRYGGQIGGPILKNKLFAFTNFERQTTGQAGSSSSFCAPTAAGITTLNSVAFASSQNLKVFEKYSPVAATQGGPGQSCAATIAVSTPSTVLTPTNVAIGGVALSLASFSNYDFSTSSLDYTISHSDTLRARYVYNREDGLDTASTFPVFFTSTPNRYHLATLDEIHTFSPNLTNDFRVGYNRYFNETAVPATNFPGLSVFPNLIFDDLGVNLGPDPNAPQGTIQNLYDATESLTWVKGKHTINVGAEGRKYIAPQLFVQRLRGDYEYSSLSLYLNDISPDTFGQRNATPPGVSPTFYGDQSSVYAFANDDYRVLPTLTLNLGVRYEFTSVPFSEKEQSLNAAASVPGVISFTQPKPQYKNFAPRIGVNYAPNENTSVRAAFGINYDVLYDNIGTTTAPPQFQTTENVSSTPSSNFLANGGLPANTTFSTLAGQRAATSAYVPDQKLPYSEQWTLGVQHVFHHDYTAELRYVGTRGVHLDVQEQIDVQSPVTPANQLPTNLTGGSVALNGAQSLAALKATVNGVPYNKVAAFYSAGLTSTITSDEPFGGSNYNGLQAQLTRRMQKGLLLNAAYTWSKAMDDSTADFNTTALNPRRPQDSQNLKAEYTRSDLDRTHRLTFEVVYDLPFFKNSNFLEKNLLGNWEITPVYTFQSPQYTTVQSVQDSNLNGDAAGDRVFINPNGFKGTGTGVVALVNTAIPCASATGLGVANGSNAVVADCNANIVGYTAGKLVTANKITSFIPDSNAYYVQGGLGTDPSAARNTLPTGRTNNLDLSLFKRISFHERYKVELGAQAFNALNHSQFLPGSLNQVNSIGSTGYRNFDTVTNAQFNQKQLVFSNNARSMQLSGKIIF